MLSCFWEYACTTNWTEIHYSMRRYGFRYWVILCIIYTLSLQLTVLIWSHSIQNIHYMRTVSTKERWLIWHILSLTENIAMCPAHGIFVTTSPTWCCFDIMAPVSFCLAVDGPGCRLIPETLTWLSYILDHGTGGHLCGADLETQKLWCRRADAGCVGIKM